MAPHIRWKADYSVGVRDFDDAHQALMDRADALIAAMNGPNPNGRCRDLLDDLLECAVAHFDEEERTLRELDWPGLPAHLQAHNVLLRTLLKFKSDLRYGRLTPDAAAEFITDWVLAHIVDEDMQYCEYLAARGVR